MDWQRSQDALLTMVERMGQMHEKNPGAGVADIRREVRRATFAVEGAFQQDSLLQLAAAAMYAWLVLAELPPAALEAAHA